ncbi:TonB-dependent receptor plug domain-containing protein [Duganella levis]|uniref:TonB-dependent receptor n=1 Tax=Duganella levis TaxID=2692169 RepID=A0ABW9VXT2_9BURK|nr:TonB-dependent receptor [Duganella levis]MYN26476.1 TonB-dependent receptor [Duganella levis]
MKSKRLYLLLLLSAKAYAQDVPQTVVVTGQSDVEANRDFVAGKIVISKKTLQESGARNVEEVLRREPAITIGKDGRIGLLGLPGYTQVLVDGQPATGVDPYELDLVQVERVEIIKSATAATGPFGIAGTINVVRRKADTKTMTQLRVSGTTTPGHPGANVTLMSNQLPSGAPVIYNFTLIAGSKETPGLEQYRQQFTNRTSSTPQFEGMRTTLNRSQSVVAGTEISWLINPSQKLSLAPDLGKFQIVERNLEQRLWTDDSMLAIHRRSVQDLTSVGVPLTWDWKITSESRLSTKINANRSHTTNDDRRTEDWSYNGDHLRLLDRNLVMRNRFLDVNYSTEFDGGHELSAGLKFAVNDADTDFNDFIDGYPDVTQTVLGAHNQTHVIRRQYFIQDDWRVSKMLALGMGVSTEQRQHELREGTLMSRPQFNIWSPSFHVAYKINGNSKRQIRASIARTFQAPEARQMLLHPQINPLAPCYKGMLCGPNTLDTADVTGNPNLQPERAIGINLSYTHGLSANSEAKVEFYTRDITGKIGNELTSERVAWANVPRYVMRPTNLGDATLRGITLETRLAMHDLWKQAPNADLQGSVSYAQSRLRDLPGPDNRLEGQLPWRAKLGATYSPQGLPLKLNLDANWLPSDWIRNNLTQRTYEAHKLTLNAGANWKINSTQRLIFNADNLLAKDSRTISEYYGTDYVLQRFSNNTAYTRFSFRLEVTL